MTEKELLSQINDLSINTQSQAWKQFAEMMLGPKYAAIGPIHYQDAWIFFREGWKSGMFWAGYGGEDS